MRISVFLTEPESPDYRYEAAAELSSTRANAFVVGYSDDSPEHALSELELALIDLGLLGLADGIDLYDYRTDGVQLRSRHDPVPPGRLTPSGAQTQPEERGLER